jgi:aryl-alcohol dehydrogenase-like predicted oxidoreductase
VEHLEENLAAASLRLTAEEFRQLSEVKRQEARR